MKTQIQDVIIVGAGPAGLMAAKTARELGLTVTMVEKGNDFKVIRRACSMQLIMGEIYEGEVLEVANGQLIFKNNHFQVDYKGPLIPITHKYYHSPKKHSIHFTRDDGEPFALKFDKAYLLNSLYEACQKLGVEFRLGTIALNGSDDGKTVQIQIVSNGKTETIVGKKLIIAEGVNAHLSTQFGFNENRTHFATAFTVKYFLEGVKNIEPTTWNLFYGKAFYANAPVIIGPSIAGEHIVEMTITGDAYLKPGAIFNRLVQDSPLSESLNEAKVVDMAGCVVRACSALTTPYKQNVLVIGDTAAFVEVEVQGALMCGHHAAYSVADELKGIKGFKNYTNWWRTAFEFNSSDYLKVSQGYALVPTYTDDELDYLFGMIEEQTLEGTYSQYRTPKLIWEAILAHEKQIQQEAPEIYSKIQRMNQMSLSDAISK